MHHDGSNNRARPMQQSKLELVRRAGRELERRPDSKPAGADVDHTYADLKRHDQAVELAHQMEARIATPIDANQIV